MKGTKFTLFTGFFEDEVQNESTNFEDVFSTNNIDKLYAVSCITPSLM